MDRPFDCPHPLTPYEEEGQPYCPRCGAPRRRGEPPEDAVAWKHDDEGGRWIYSEDEARRLASEDPARVAPAWGGESPWEEAQDAPDDEEETQP